MAGAVGFEPTVHGTKNRCLTTWLRPKKPQTDCVNTHQVAAL